MCYRKEEAGNCCIILSRHVHKRSWLPCHIHMKLSTPTVKDNASKLHKTVYDFCKKRFPLFTIFQEYTIFVNNKGMKEHLYVDIFIKELNLAIELNGVQHYKTNNFFYNGSFEFKKAKERDKLKQEWCQINGVALAIFKYDDKLDYEFFNQTIDKTLRRAYNG